MADDALCDDHCTVKPCAHCEENDRVAFTAVGTNKQEELAHAVLDAVRSALAAGVKHFNKAGTELKTPKAILECLLEEGGVVLQEPKSLQPTE